jgi:hypothetical protein
MKGFLTSARTQFPLRNQPQLFAPLDCLCSSLGAEFVEQPAGMCLDGALADEKAFSNLAVAQTVRNQPEYFQFAFGDRQFLQSFFVQSKRSPGGDQNFSFDDDLLFPRELEPEPDAHTGEDKRRQAAVNLDRVFHYDKTVLDHLERRDQQPATKAVDQTINKNLFLHVNE